MDDENLIAQYVQSTKDVIYKCLVIIVNKLFSA